MQYNKHSFIDWDINLTQVSSMPCVAEKYLLLHVPPQFSTQCLVSNIADQLWKDLQKKPNSRKGGGAECNF